MQLGSPAARLVPPKGLLPSIKRCAPFHQKGTSIGSSEFENKDWHKSILWHSGKSEEVQLGFPVARLVSQKDLKSVDNEKDGTRTTPCSR